jgi:archaellum component FlaG (FlaF/FlaG flagellin family)
MQTSQASAPKSKLTIYIVAAMIFGFLAGLLV